MVPSKHWDCKHMPLCLVTLSLLTTRKTTSPHEEAILSGRCWKISTRVSPLSFQSFLQKELERSLPTPYFLRVQVRLGHSLLESPEVRIFTWPPQEPPLLTSVQVLSLPHCLIKLWPPTSPLPHPWVSGSQLKCGLLHYSTYSPVYLFHST